MGTFTDPKLYAINPDGTEKWSFYTKNAYSAIASSPAIGYDGTIYVVSENRKLWAIKADGTEKWVFTAGGDVNSSPAIGSDGTIYVGSNDGKLYAIYGGSGGLAHAPWPMFHHDLKHTGSVSGEFMQAEGMFYLIPNNRGRAAVIYLE